MSGRDLDVAVASRVLGFGMEVFQPPNYPVPVTIFRAHDGTPVYTYDARSCNFMLFRNGRDDREGFVRPLPFYSDDLNMAWEAVVALQRHPEQHALFTRYMADADVWMKPYPSQLAAAICRAAVRAVETLEQVH